MEKDRGTERDERRREGKAEIDSSEGRREWGRTERMRKEERGDQLVSAGSGGDWKWVELVSEMDRIPRSALVWFRKSTF